MARENKSKYAIMAMLSMGPMSGYDIKKLLEERVTHFWNESYGQIYPILKLLQQEGLAEKTVERQEGKPDRNVFELSAEGLEALRQWQRLPVAKEKRRIEIVLKLVFGSKVAHEDLILQIERFRDMEQEMLVFYTCISEGFDLEFAADPDAPFKRMALNFGLHETRAHLAWSDETLKMLRNMEPSKGQQG